MLQFLCIHILIQIGQCRSLLDSWTQKLRSPIDEKFSLAYPCRSSPPNENPRVSLPSPDPNPTPPPTPASPLYSASPFFSPCSCACISLSPQTDGPQHLSLSLSRRTISLSRSLAGPTKTSGKTQTSRASCNCSCRYGLLLCARFFFSNFSILGLILV